MGWNGRGDLRFLALVASHWDIFFLSTHFTPFFPFNNRAAYLSSWDKIQYGNTTVKEMDRFSLYEKALNTWAKWVDSHVDPKKTKVFLSGCFSRSCQHAPYKCHELPEPNTTTDKSRGSSSRRVSTRESTKSNVQTSVFAQHYYLVTARIDGHPASAGRGVDCTHW
ncbi:Protein trichome birefringence-like 43 [Abeliophyllum distichum]|uniref:Protein trichome birefringence-like 43 n=1 Tax=Abeliophyllum distichum TaxID=126358 RepID=A0ABD1UHZ5_9LAMI